MQSQRNVLMKVEKPQPDTHPGLWLDKYLPYQKEKEKGNANDETHKNLILQLAGLSEPTFYKSVYERWVAQMQAAGIHLRRAVARGRIVVGLGTESVIETGIALHRTYGVPYLPGSALKGLAAAYAHQNLGKHWSSEADAHKVLFGTLEQAGCVKFYDALLIPGSSSSGKPLHLDIMAVHHPNYYQGTGEAPADWDQPTIINFLTATGNYHIALSGPEQWVDAAYEILGLALQASGIGAKTSAGYGRMVLDAKPVDPTREIVERFQTRLDALKAQDVANRINSFYTDWKSLDIAAPWKATVARAIVKKVQEAGREKASAGKPWFEELKQYIQENL